MSSWKVRLLMALTILTMLLTMSAAPAMAHDFGRFDDPFLGCFDCDHHIDHFNQPFLGCFDCDDDFFDDDEGDFLILDPGQCAVVHNRLLCNNNPF